MFVFITSVLHPRNCHSYRRIGELLGRSLRSVCGQTSPNYRVVVVCNRVPPVGEKLSKVEFVQVDFPPPGPHKSAFIDRDVYRTDKGAKCTVGLLHAFQYKPRYIMIFDADDLVSNRIVEFTETQKECSGWYLKKGYKLRDGDVTMEKMDRFHGFCGTSFILHHSLLHLPEDLSKNSSKRQIVEGVDSYFLKYILGSHTFSQQYFKEHEKPLLPLPFYGAIWMVETGENRQMGHHRYVRPDIYLTEDICDEFGIRYPNLKVTTLCKTLCMMLKYRIGRLVERLRRRIRYIKTKAF